MVDPLGHLDDPSEELGNNREGSQSTSVNGRIIKRILDADSGDSISETVVDIDGELYFLHDYYHAEFVAKKVAGLNLHVQEAFVDIISFDSRYSVYKYIREKFNHALQGSRGATLFHFSRNSNHIAEDTLDHISPEQRQFIDIYLRKWQDCFNVINFVLDYLEDKQDSLTPPPVTVRLRQLTAYASKYGDEGVPALAALLFPEWSDAFVSNRKQPPVFSPPLPMQAPETYQGIRSGELPPDFIKRVYEPWIGNGLTKADLRQLDPGLYRALYNWVGRGNALPDDLPLPTRREANDELVKDFIDARGKPLNEVLSDARRIESAARYRLKAK